MEPNRQESIVTQYATLISENKEKRKQRGEWHENEPAELIYDESCGDGTDINGKGEKEFLPWQFTNLISQFCVQDIIGDDYLSTCRLLEVNSKLEWIEVPNETFGAVIYFREQAILRVIDILKTLAKSNFISILRPQYKLVNNELVFTNADIMNLLDIKEERLRKFREKGYLGYTKYEGSDKFWYTQKDVQAFLNHPKARHEPD